VFPIVLALATAAGLRAQCNSEVLALHDPGAMLERIDFGACTAIGAGTGLGTAVQLYAGGVAHDPRDRATWVSDGTLLVKIDRASGASVCGPFAAPNLPAGVVVTGLAYNEATQQLFVSHSNNNILTYSAIGCTLVLQNTCAVTVPTTHVIGGLASEDPANMLFYITSAWLGAGPASELVVAPMSSPCTPACAPQTLPGCFGTLNLLASGLGFDACSGVLYVAERAGIRAYTTAYWPLCNPVAAGCCLPPPAPQHLRGLCMLPPLETSSGGPCFQGTVPSCLTMQHVLRGDPAIGNLGFGLDLVSCPGQTLAFLRVNLGCVCVVPPRSCTSGPRRQCDCRARDRVVPEPRQITSCRRARTANGPTPPSAIPRRQSSSRSSANPTRGPSSSAGCTALTFSCATGAARRSSSGMP
jgi:hypothetical protein